MQIISNIALISINETLIVQVLSFLVFLYIINRIMIRPLRSVMSERESHIKSIQQDIVTAGSELESLSNEIEERQSAVRMEGFEQKKKLEEAGSRQADEIFSSSSKEIAAEKEKVKHEINAQVLEARKYLKAESETLALSIMEKILDRRLNP